MIETIKYNKVFGCENSFLQTI